MFITSVAALSMSLVVAFDLLMTARRVWVLSSDYFVVLSPSWCRSIRGFGIGSMNGGLFLVVGTLVGLCGICGDVSPTCGIVAMRALWSLYMVSIGVVWAYVYIIACVSREAQKPVV